MVRQTITKKGVRLPGLGKRNLHYRRISFVKEVEEILGVEIAHYQRTGEATNRLGAIMEMIFFPLVEDVAKVFNLSHTVEDMWQDAYIQIQSMLPKYDMTKGEVGIWLLWRGYYAIIHVCNGYYKEPTMDALIEVKDEGSVGSFYADDFIAVLNTFDWVYPPEICLMASMIIICGNGGRDGASVKKMIRNTYANGDKVLTQHIYNHVVVNTRIGLSIVSNLHTLEGLDETMGIGSEGDEEDFNNLRNISDLRGGYNEEVNRPIWRDYLTSADLERDR
jgi:hypothetical protein